MAEGDGESEGARERVRRIEGRPLAIQPAWSPPKSIASCWEARSGVDQLDPADRDSACCGQLCGAPDYPDRQHFALAADLDLMQRRPGKVEPRARHGLIGDNEFAGKVLGQAFESACGVDGVADRGNRDGIAIAHLSDDGRPAMNADTDAQRPIEFGPQRSVQFVETRGNEPGGGERLSAALERCQVIG
jgi:hypothetical protein